MCSLSGGFPDQVVAQCKMGGLCMATQAWPQKTQKMEFDVTTSEGPGRVTIVTGIIQIWLQAFSQGQQQIRKESYKVLVEPTLTPRQFRKAVATASLSYIAQSGPAATEVQWAVEDAQATLDDEAGQVQLVVDVTAIATGGAPLGLYVTTYAVMFQVTTLALI